MQPGISITFALVLQVISNCSTFFEEGSTCDGSFTIQKRSVNIVPYKVFTIGAETDCENRYYCNGPLKPDTIYYVTLRAYTTMQYQDTPFSEAIRTARICKLTLSKTTKCRLFQTERVCRRHFQI